VSYHVLPVLTAPVDLSECSLKLRAKNDDNFRAVESARTGCRLPLQCSVLLRSRVQLVRPTYFVPRPMLCSVARVECSRNNGSDECYPARIPRMRIVVRCCYTSVTTVSVT
jgi:hypothetical protein